MMEQQFQRSGYAEANGTSFYYESEGSGSPVVFIHAGIADSRMWDGQFDVLARDFRVLRYDTRGYGRTGVGTGGYSRSDDLYGLLSALGIEKASLVGCSQGGTTAIDFALEHPEMVDALVAVSASPNGYQFTGEPPARLMAFFSAFQTGDLSQAAELATQIWLDGPRRGPDDMDPAVRGRVHAMMVDVVGSEGLDLTGERFSKEPAVDRLSQITCPTLVVIGEFDDPAVVQAGEHVASGIPLASAARIAGGHLLNVEQPEAFNQVVREFLLRRE